MLAPASLGSLQLFHFEVQYFSRLMLPYCSILLRYCSRLYRSRYASDSTVGIGFIDGIERNILPVWDDGRTARCTCGARAPARLATR